MSVILRIMFNESVKKQIKDAVKKYLSDTNYKVFIFGSRASGEHRRWSDIDVGILGRQKIPGSTIMKIEEELENSRIPFKIDIVDFKTVSGQFYSLAFKKVITL